MLKEWIETTDPEILLSVGLIIGTVIGILFGWLFSRNALEYTRSDLRLEREFRRIDKENWESALDRAERDVEFYTTQYRSFLNELTECHFIGNAGRDRVIKELNKRLSESYVDPKTLEVHDKRQN